MLTDTGIHTAESPPSFSLPLLQYPLMFGGGAIADNAVPNLKEALGWLEGFFGDNQYVAGAKQTVADFSLASTVATIEVREISGEEAPPSWDRWG